MCNMALLAETILGDTYEVTGNTEQEFRNKVSLWIKLLRYPYTGDITNYRIK